MMGRRVAFVLAIIGAGLVPARGRAAGRGAPVRAPAPGQHQAGRMAQGTAPHPGRRPGGHLDEFWADIKDSAWFGGKAEGWERVPYWLDGLVPLAYLLDDPALEAKVKKAIGYILDHQHPDGWFGPVGDSPEAQAL